MFNGWDRVERRDPTQDVRRYSHAVLMIWHACFTLRVGASLPHLSSFTTRFVKYNVKFSHFRSLFNTAPILRRCQYPRDMSFDTDLALFDINVLIVC